MLTVLDHLDPMQAEEIRRVLHAGYCEEASLIGVLDFPPLRRTAADIAGSTGSFHGFQRGGVLAGVVEHGVEERPGGQAVEIRSLAVDPRYARQGIGSTLVGFVIERHAGCAITVSTARSNVPAIALYRGLGFGVQGHFMARGGIDCVSLVRPG